MLNGSGILIGLTAFIVIGVLHPVVIRCEYYFSDRVWPVFLAGGLAFCTASLFVERPLLSSVLGVVGFSLLWSIRELKQQTRRVETCAEGVSLPLFTGFAALRPAARGRNGCRTAGVRGQLSACRQGRVSVFAYKVGASFRKVIIATQRASSR